MAGVERSWRENSARSRAPVELSSRLHFTHVILCCRATFGANLEENTRQEAANKR